MYHHVSCRLKTGGLHTFEGPTEKGLKRDIQKHENLQAHFCERTRYRGALAWNQAAEERNQPDTLLTFVVRQ